MKGNQNPLGKGYFFITSRCRERFCRVKTWPFLKVHKLSSKPPYRDWALLSIWISKLRRPFQQKIFLFETSWPFVIHLESKSKSVREKIVNSLTKDLWYEFFSIETFLWKWYFDSLHCTREDLWSIESVLSEKNKDSKKNILGGITLWYRVLKTTHTPKLVEDPLDAFRRYFDVQNVFFESKF